MVTFVGIQASFIDAVKDLIELDYDAAEAYEAAIDRLENEDFKAQLTAFKNDHKRHANVFSNFLRQHDQIDIHEGPSVKQWVTKGKVILSSLVGDKTILRALISNEIDTNTAYERLLYHDDIPMDAIQLAQQGLADERRHKQWLEDTLESI